jgi:hypothetical protein
MRVPKGRVFLRIVGLASGWAAQELWRVAAALGNHSAPGRLLNANRIARLPIHVAVQWFLHDHAKECDWDGDTSTSVRAGLALTWSVNFSV